MVAFGSITADTDVTFGGGSVELFYGQITAAAVISATADATPQEIIPGAAVTYTGVPVWIEFFAPQARSQSAADLRIALWDASTSIGIIGTLGAGGGAQNILPVPVYLKRRLTPSAGSHTYRVCAAGTGSPRIEAGTGVYPFQAPAFLRIST